MKIIISPFLKAIAVDHPARMTSDKGKAPKKEESVDSESSVDSRKGVSWGHLMVDFTQGTTLHGVRYITATTPYIVRR